MLTALHIGNFKAFADTQRIPLRPLTLIYGANSAGKSTIIHSLLLVRHALETGDLDMHGTTIGGDSVDLGGFRQYVNELESSHRVEWAVDLDASNFKGRLAEFFAPVRTVTMAVSVGFAIDDQGFPIPDAIPEVLTYEIKADGHGILRMSRRRDGKLQLDSLDHEHPVFREAIKAMVLLSTTTEDLRPEDYTGLEETIAALVPQVVATGVRFLPDGLAKSEVFAPGSQTTLFPISKGRRREDLAAAVRSCLPRKIDELLKGINEVVAGEMARLQYLGPLRSFPPRHLAFSQHHDPNWYAGGGYAWDVVRRDARVRALVNEWLNSKERLQTPYELVIRKLVDLDELVGFLWGGGMEYVNEAISAIDPILSPPLQYRKERNKVVTETILHFVLGKLDELILMDRRSNTVVSHRDVGIGISQVLPVLVSAYAAKNRILAIEQPEIHLHPALQADLGDVFIQAAIGEARNHCIIETHSEHLLLRIMRRMRETAQGKKTGLPAVRPSDVSVLFVQREGERSVALELRLDEEGMLIDPWPGGFFEEGFRERFGEPGE
ncbi:MAG: DUF3696 domain-containing protein [Planctomycetes bacterium]|nr:DUF3696 domain-containing protein [Planctomycetota bacterium]